VKNVLLQYLVSTALSDNSIYYIHISKVTLLCTNQHTAICFLHSWTTKAPVMFCKQRKAAAVTISFWLVERRILNTLWWQSEKLNSYAFRNEQLQFHSETFFLAFLYPVMKTIEKSYITWSRGYKSSPKGFSHIGTSSVYAFRRYTMVFINTVFGHSFDPIKNITTSFSYILRVVLKLLSIHT
jgi:hypothetical protein